MKLSKNTIVFISWIVLLAAIIYLNFLHGVVPVPLKKPFLYFPYEIGQWKDKEKPSSNYLITALGADDITVREYENKDGEKLELYFSYFEYTQEKKAPHAPQLCWVGSGWEFKSLGEEKLTLNCLKCPQVSIRKILAQKEDYKILLFYCYRANKEYVSDFSKFRSIIVRDSMLKRRNSAFTLQLSSDVNGEGLEKKEELMKDFLLQVFPILETEFLP